MDLFNHELESSGMQGINFSSLLTISYRFFADNLGIFIPATALSFEEVCGILKVYEEATGAKLNIQKSVIVPLGLTTIPDWLIAMGCRISQEGEVQHYLGGPFGWNLPRALLHNFCLNQIAKKLSSWALRQLTFARRAILIKHVLMAMPVYHMMLLNSSTELIQKMNHICRGFLWGTNSDGGKRVPLMAWATITRPKIDGGWPSKILRPTPTLS